MKKDKSKAKPHNKSEQKKVKAREEDIVNRIMSEKDEAYDTVTYRE